MIYCNLWVTASCFHIRDIYVSYLELCRYLDSFLLLSLVFIRTQTYSCFIVLGPDKGRFLFVCFFFQLVKNIFIGPCIYQYVFAKVPWIKYHSQERQLTLHLQLIIITSTIMTKRKYLQIKRAASYHGLNSFQTTSIATKVASLLHQWKLKFKKWFTHFKSSTRFGILTTTTKMEYTEKAIYHWII